MDLLREHDDFRHLWLAQTVSQIGGQITYLALPLTAAVALQASPVEMGVLTVMGALPSLAVGLLAGEMVDRHQRRPMLIAADLARAVLLTAIPPRLAGRAPQHVPALRRCLPLRRLRALF